MKELLDAYLAQKEKIQSRLNEFKVLPEKEQFNEFLFCILTPQSNARKCWQAIEQISKIKNPTEQEIFEILKTKTRFHKTKTSRILRAKESWEKIKMLLGNQNRKELRNEIAKIADGYGLKESSHFLRNIGKSDNQIAILDRHILRNLNSLGLIKEIKIKNKNNYFEIEDIFLKFAKKAGISPDELDLLWWGQENGMIFK